MAYGALNVERQCSWAAVSGQFGLCATLGENTETNLVTFAWRMALSMLRDSVRGLPCQVIMAGALLVVRILWQLGYVRVAYGALHVASQYSCRTAAARGDSTGAVLGQG